MKHAKMELIGKQKNLDLNKNGKIDSEDLRMIRENRMMANGGGVDDMPTMDEFISDLAKKNKNEFSVNQYHIFRDKQFKIGLEKNYYKDTDKNYTEFDRRLGAALKVDWEYADGGMMAFYEGQSVLYPMTNNTKLDKSVREIFNKYANKELVIEKIMDEGGKYKIAKVFVRSSGEKVPFDLVLNPKYLEQYADGGMIYEVGIDNGKDGTRTLADFEKEKDAEKFMYDYNLTNPNAKLFIDTVTSDSGYMAKGGKIDGGGKGSEWAFWAGLLGLGVLGYFGINKK